MVSPRGAHTRTKTQAARLQVLFVMQCCNRIKLDSDQKKVETFVLHLWTQSFAAPSLLPIPPNPPLYSFILSAEAFHASWLNTGARLQQRTDIHYFKTRYTQGNMTHQAIEAVH